MCLKQIFFWLIVLGLIQIILWKKKKNSLKWKYDLFYIIDFYTTYNI